MTELWAAVAEDAEEAEVEEEEQEIQEDEVVEDHCTPGGTMLRKAKTKGNRRR